MTEKLRQSLSAVIDDEADAFELRRVLDELGRDDELRALWDRYHLIGNALRGEPVPSHDALRERIWAALEAAPAAPASGDAPAAFDSAPASARDVAATVDSDAGGSRLGRYTALAVAASVAFAVVIGFNAIGPGDDEVPEVATLEAPGPGTPAVAAVAGGGFDPVPTEAEVSPRDVRRAQAYMLHHAQQQALNQAGVMSFVKLATYEAP